MVTKHSDFPPPWIYSEGSHPHGIDWQTGSGETYVLAFDEWWDQEAKSYEERIEYFRKWPAPPKWCGWMANAIWAFNPWDTEHACGFAPFFERLKSLGFGGTDEYESELNSYDCGN